MAKVKRLSRGLIFKILIAVILILAIAIIGMMFLKKSSTSGDQRDAFAALEGMEFERDAMSASFVAASGVTNVGMVSETFPVEGLTEGLEVEEVLAESGAQITSETAVIKFTEASVATAREELQKVLRDAELAWRSGKIEYEQEVIQAENTYKTTLLNGTYAADIYEETIANMEENVEKTREAYEEAKAEIDEYQAAMLNGTYTAELEKWQAAYDTNYKMLQNTMDTWGFTWQEVTGGRANGWGATERDQYLTAARKLYSVLDLNQQYLTEAKENYEEKVTNGTTYLKMLQLSLPELDEAYATAQANYETSLIQAKLTRETSLAEAELAEKMYETNLEKAKSDFENLEEAYEDAKKNLEVFEAQAGTGYYYPTESGTVLRVSARVGREITSGGTIVTISNYEEMKVTVSVDQADISKIGIGDSVIIYSEDSGMAEGVVTRINPVSSSAGRGSITYSVTVEVTGQNTQISNNESVYVYFSVGGNDEEA